MTKKVKFTLKQPANFISLPICKYKCSEINLEAASTLVHPGDGGGVVGGGVQQIPDWITIVLKQSLTKSTKKNKKKL